MLVNGQGIIDADYYDNPDNEGHIMIAIYNPTNETVVIDAGERVAQGIFYHYLLADDDNGTTALRQGGFGSTGYNVDNLISRELEVRVAKVSRGAWQL